MDPSETPPPWQLEAEKLLGLVGSLVAERDRFAELLVQAGHDLEVAHRRIDQLEALNNALIVELYRLKKPGHRTIVGLLAKGVAAIVVALGAGVGEGVGSELYAEIRAIGAQASAVGEACSTDAENGARASGAPAGVAGPRSGVLPVGSEASVGEIQDGQGVVETDLARRGTPQATFVKSFKVEDWKPGNDGVELFFSAEDHAAGETPSATVQIVRDDGAFEDVGVSVQTLSDGSIRIGASEPFTGRIIVR
ncbi:MAG: hypothetical protein M3Q48_02715 [Actinomycetota bacterium]|nr:hypothetical protein [Actinomycetota bacterium]